MNRPNFKNKPYIHRIRKHQKRTFSKQTSTFLFTLFTVVLIVISFISYTRIQHYDDSVESVFHTKDLKDKIIAVSSNLKDAEIGQRGYLLTNDSAFLETYFGSEKRIKYLFASLDSLFQDNAYQLDNFNVLKTLVEERYLILNNNLKLLTNKQPDKFKDELMLKGKNKMDDVMKQINLLLQEEDRIEAEHIHDKNRAATLPPIYTLILSLLSIIFITFFFFRLQKETGLRMNIQEKYVMDELSRKKIEASESRLRNFIMQAPAMLALLKGSDHRVEIISPLYTQFLGNRDLLGKSVIEDLPEMIGQGYIEILDKVYKTGISFTGNEMPVMIDKGNGIQQFYTNFTYQAFKNDQDETQGILCYAYDVTAQVNARKVVESSEAKFRNLILQAPVFINTFYGPTFIVDTINKIALEIWGKSYEQVINKPIFESSPELEDGIKKILNDVYFKGEPFIANEIPIQLKRPGKKNTAYFNSVYQPLRDLNNKIIGIIVIGTEVTETVNARKQIEESEEFNRTVLESSPDCLNIFDRDGHIHYINSNGLRQMEIDDYSIFKNKKWWTIWGIKNELIAKESVSKALNGETAKFTAFCLTDKGTPKWWDVMVSPVVKSGEPIQQIISVSRDVTDEKNAEIQVMESVKRFRELSESLEAKVKTRTEELNVKNRELENSNAELETFSYIASHDLQEPLRKIQTFSKRIIEVEKFSDKTQDYFNRIIAASERMQNLIGSLLSFSRTNTNGLKYELCDLNTIVEESKNDLSLRILEKQVIIEYERLPIVKGVYILIAQLFTNLIENSIKYSRPEINPHIKITADLIHGNKIEHPSINKQIEYHILKITDNGIGFEEQYENKIFGLFQRLHGSNEFSGSGIGLSICKKIINYHNGFITGEGKPNIGSTFTIYIPTS